MKKYLFLLAILLIPFAYSSDPAHIFDCYGSQGIGKVCGFSTYSDLGNLCYGGICYYDNIWYYRNSKPPFTGFKTVYNSIKERQQNLFSYIFPDGRVFRGAKISGVFEYHLRDFVQYDYQLGDDFLERRNILYGYDGDSCSDQADAWSNPDLVSGTCSDSKYIYPYYLDSCYFKCDSSSQKVDITFSSSCQEKLNTAVNGKLSGSLIGSNCFDYATRWECDYTDMNGNYAKRDNLSIEFGCTVRMRKEYQAPVLFGDNTFLGYGNLMDANAVHAQDGTTSLNNVSCSGSLGYCYGTKYKDLEAWEMESFGSYNPNGYAEPPGMSGDSINSRFRSVFPRAIVWAGTPPNQYRYVQGYAFTPDDIVIKDYFHTAIKLIYDNSTNGTEVTIIGNGSDSSNGNNSGDNIGSGGGNGNSEGDGTGQGNTGSATDNSQIIKIIEAEKKIDDIKGRGDFIDNYLKVAYAVADFFRIFYYIFELSVVIFIFFKWIPDSLFAVEDILTKFLRGK